MKQRLDRQTLAMRVAKEFQDGDVVNLGVGIPTLASSFVPEGRTIICHSENGMLGFGHVLTEDEADKADIDYTNAGGGFVGLLPGACFFDHADAFCMIRGGHIDVTVLGGLQVSEKGDLSNWQFPGRDAGNIGGGMDLAAGAKRVIVAMEHTTKSGEPKIVKECTYPLTAKECVDLIVTDLAVIEVTEQGLLLKEVAPGFTADEVQAVTEPRLIVAKDLKEIEL